MTISNLNIAEIIIANNVTPTLEVCLLPNLYILEMYQGLIRFHLG